MFLCLKDFLVLTFPKEIKALKNVKFYSTTRSSSEFRYGDQGSNHLQEQPQTTEYSPLRDGTVVQWRNK